MYSILLFGGCTCISIAFMLLFNRFLCQSHSRNEVIVRGKNLRKIKLYMPKNILLLLSNAYFCINCIYWQCFELNKINSQLLLRCDNDE